jgi:hypothetical protein
VTDDLNQIKTSPISTMVGWVKEDLDIFNLSFNEEWDTQTKYLHEIIFDILKNDFKVGGAEKVIPAPGWSQGLLFGFLKAMGLTDSDAYDIPFGDPNLLREAAYRDYDKQGLKSTMNISFETIYEQKIIGDFDPATAMLDILRNILKMGTSDMRYIFKANSPILKQLTSAVNGKGNNIDEWALLVKEIVDAFIEAIGKTFENISGKKLDDAANDFENLSNEQKSEDTRLIEINNELKILDKKPRPDGWKARKKELETEKKSLDKSVEAKQGQEKAKQNELENNQNIQNAAAVNASIGTLKNISDDSKTSDFLRTIVASTFAKHRWPIRGSIGAMTGQPTTPWHITIGNPWSPIVSAGNMIVDKIDLSAKGEMGFNDMPIFLNATVNLRFGRNMGAQEIERIFNNGYQRIYNKPQNDQSRTDKTKPKDNITKPPTYNN